METKTITPVVAPPAPPSFNNREWLRMLVAQVGGSVDKIPEAVLNRLLATTNKLELNKEFFTWFESSKEERKVTLTPEDEAVFNSIVSVKNTGSYQAIRREVQNYRTQAENSLRDVRTYLSYAAKKREELAVLEGKFSHPLVDEIKAILADGWYRYHPDMTTHVNRGSEAAHTLVFSTPSVNLQYYNREAGVEMNVDMGEYYVYYKPNVNEILVKGKRNNLDVEGYMHPHVASGGGVCWGNAGNLYTNAMNDYKPSKAFQALRVILCTYNDDSPYITALEFAVERSPEKYADRMGYQEQEARAWIRRANLNTIGNLDWSNHITDEGGGSNDDGISWYQEEGVEHSRDLLLFRVFEQAVDGIRFGGNSYYVQCTDGSYVQASISDWRG